MEQQDKTTRPSENGLNSFGIWWGRSIGKIIPRFLPLPLATCYLVNCVTYLGTQKLMANAFHTDMTTAFDRMIPVVPAWIFIYCSFFLFWFGNFIYIAKLGKEHWYRFMAADLLTRAICAAIFILLPTTNVRPDIVGQDVASKLLRYVYMTDPPTDLFPSIHCLVSWLCFIGLRGNPKVPKWYRRFSCVFALLICASTLFVRQHVIADVVSGIAIAEICYAVSQHTNLYRPLLNGFNKLERLAFSKKQEPAT